MLVRLFFGLALVVVVGAVVVGVSGCGWGVVVVLFVSWHFLLELVVLTLVDLVLLPLCLGLSGGRVSELLGRLSVGDSSLQTVFPVAFCRLPSYSRTPLLAMILWG